tara:strand:- start:161 stop:811 length:651 start_codon:yes stop_codon:yes gene_type:complete
MKNSVIFVSLLILMSFVPILNLAEAEPAVSIETSQSIYHYGEYLSITINVSEVTGDFATIHITDPSQKKSILLQPPISQETHSFPSNHPFDSAIWKSGSYILELEYSGAISSTQFSIQDSGEVAIPFWIRDLAKMWITEPLVTDKDFGRAIEYLIQHEVIKIPYTEPEGDAITSIPDWVKTNAGWWVTEKISDTEFALALQYLIKKGIILVNLPTV